MKLLSLSVFSLVLLAGCGLRPSTESGDGTSGPAANAAAAKEGGCCGADSGCCAGKEKAAAPTAEGDSCCADKAAAKSGEEGSCCAEAPAPGGTTAPATTPTTPRFRFPSGSGQ